MTFKLHIKAKISHLHPQYFFFLVLTAYQASHAPCIFKQTHHLLFSHIRQTMQNNWTPTVRVNMKTQYMGIAVNEVWVFPMSHGNVRSLQELFCDHSKTNKVITGAYFEVREQNNNENEHRVLGPHLPQMMSGTAVLCQGLSPSSLMWPKEATFCFLSKLSLI